MAMVFTRCLRPMAFLGSTGSINGCTLKNTNPRRNKGVKTFRFLIYIEDQKRFSMDDLMGRTLGYMKAFAD